jgi:hypothetical protein
MKAFFSFPIVNKTSFALIIENDALVRISLSLYNRLKLIIICSDENIPAAIDIVKES